MLNTFSLILKEEGYPLYTKSFMDLSNFYIKDGKLIKNRGNKFTTKLGEIMNFNNIVIEENGFIEVFCNREKEILYKQKIKTLTEHYNLSIKDFVKIISE